MSRGSRRGFTLIEVVVSLLLLGVGIVGVLGGLSAITQSESRLEDRETMDRLAIDKLEELLATGDVDSATLSGDFSDRAENRFTWSATVQPTGIQDLEYVQVTIARRSNDQVTRSVEKVFYRPPETTAGATQ
ncbi:MAG: prepilin-type N-terminal cleavage/methylation domain-containing protein [Fimbriimonas sp.]